METRSLTLTTGEAVVAGSIIGSTIGFIIFLCLAYWIVTIIATWKIFKKAGEPGWKCFIPIYNIYIMYKIVGMKAWFWGMILAALVLSIVMGIDGTANTFDMSKTELEAYDWNAHIPSVIAIVAYSIAAVIIEIKYAIRTSRAFGHGAGFAAGLFFLQPIFWLILAFGSSKYNKKKALN